MKQPISPQGQLFRGKDGQVIDVEYELKSIEDGFSAVNTSVNEIQSQLYDSQERIRKLIYDSGLFSYDGVLLPKSNPFSLLHLIGADFSVSNHIVYEVVSGAAKWSYSNGLMTMTRLPLAAGQPIVADISENAVVNAGTVFCLTTRDSSTQAQGAWAAKDGVYCLFIGGGGNAHLITTEEGTRIKAYILV